MCNEGIIIIWFLIGIISTIFYIKKCSEDDVDASGVLLFGWAGGIFTFIAYMVYLLIIREKKL